MSTVHFRDQDWEVTIDPDGMSFDEMEQMEAALNMAWGLIEDRSKGKNVSMKVVRGMLWISLKRAIPDLPFDETASIKMSDLKLQDADPLDSTPGSTNPPA